MEFVFYLILLLRSSLDHGLEAIKIGGGLSAGALFNLGILGLGTLLFLRRGLPSFPSLAWLPFLLVCSASLIWADDTLAAFRLLLVIFTYALAFVMPFLIKKGELGDVRLVKAIVFSSAIPLLGTIIQKLATGAERVNSTFMHPNVLAFYLVVIIGLLLFLLASRSIYLDRRKQPVVLAYVGLLAAATILTQTRSAWASMLLLFVAFAFFVNRKLLLLIVLLPAVLFIPAISERLSDLTQGTEVTAKPGTDGLNSYAWRKLMWESALDDAAGSPVLGKGIGSFGPNALRFFPLVDPIFYDNPRGIGAHSVYVQLIYETGYTGLIGFLFIYAAIIVRSLRYVSMDPKGWVIAMTLLFTYMLECYSDNMLDYGPVNLYFWFVLGIIFSRWEYDRQRQATPYPSNLLQPRSPAALPLIRLEG